MGVSGRLIIPVDFPQEETSLPPNAEEVWWAPVDGFGLSGGEKYFSPLSEIDLQLSCM